MSALIIFILLCFVTPFTVANTVVANTFNTESEKPFHPNPSITVLYDQATLMSLSKSSRWLALLHWNQGSTFRNKNESYVDDDHFFLSAKGQYDPYAELQATLSAMQSAQDDIKHQTVCRFPARYRFLAEAFNWSPDQPLQQCPDYQEWKAAMQPGQLVLVYPASYLNSPSSMFGHTLLRLDPKPNPDSSWLSQAINFGALTNAQDNSLFYAWRGLAGGYPGQFSIVPYVKKIQDYAHLENRDMWEYALNLTSDELDWLVRHLWELKGVNFDYYFLDENCSFRLLELIEVARPSSQLLNSFRLAELPVNTVRTLDAAGLIVERRYRPSKAMELDHLSQQLNSNERQLAQQILSQKLTLDSEVFSNTASDSQHLIAKTVFQASRLRNRRITADKETSKFNFALLQTMQQHEAPSIPNIISPTAPEQGHQTKMWGVDLGYEDSIPNKPTPDDPNKGFVDWSWRATYHNEMDPIEGFLKGAGIEALSFRFRSQAERGTKLEAFDFIRIRSISPHTAFEKPISWFVHASMEREQFTNGSKEPATFLTGGPGISFKTGNWLPYAFLNLRTEHLSPIEPWLRTAAGTEWGTLYYGHAIQMRLQLRYLVFDDGEENTSADLTLSKVLSTNTSLRFECHYQEWGECRLGWHSYYK